jgi:GDP-4-dehydro-6-deoxy-D-mannose reductase
MRALVTGASGFVGGYLVAHLDACGDDVVAAGDDVDVTDPDAISSAVAAARPDVIYHLAARSHVGDSWADIGSVLRVNVEGTAHVLAAARSSRVARVLVVGSAEEYGRVRPEDLPVTEDTALRPTTPYGASKVAASFLALQAHLGSGLDTVRVRSFSHTGPGQSDRFLIPALARRVARAEADGTDTVAVGNLDPVRDLSDVRDVVRAYRLLADRGTAGEVYNVCRGEGLAVSEIAGRLIGRARRPLLLVRDEDLARPVDVARLVGDPSKLRAATGWSPEYSIDETLDAVLEHERRAVQSS